MWPTLRVRGSVPAHVNYPPYTRSLISGNRLAELSAVRRELRIYRRDPSLDSGRLPVTDARQRPALSPVRTGVPDSLSYCSVHLPLCLTRSPRLS